MEDNHTEESSDGTLARGDDHSNYTHKQEYVEVIDAVDELKEPDYRLRSYLKMIKADKRGQSNLNMLLMMKLM
jgi:hypothetical protein